MVRTSKPQNMSPLCVRKRVILTAICVTWGTLCTAQDALASLLPMRWVAGQSFTRENKGRLSGGYSNYAALDVYRRAVDQGVASGSLETSRIQATWILPKRSSVGETFGFTCTIEDDRLGASVQRFRAAIGGHSKIRIDQDFYLLGGLRLGYGQRNWLNPGIWDSQYLANPAQPELAESGEGRLEETKGYLETGLELGLMGKLWTVAYSLQNTPVDQGFYVYTTDRYTTQHRLLLAHRTQFDMAGSPLRNLSWIEAQRQGPSSVTTIGTTVEFTIGQDSQLTELKSASAIGVGMLYRSTRQLSPVLSCNFLRNYTVWLAPDWGVGADYVQTGWSVGGRFVL